MTQPSKDELAVINEILDLATEVTLASVRPDGMPHASTTHFAHRGLTLYLAIAIDSEKSHNVQHCSRVAYTINTSYRSWREIRGLAVDATARLVTGVEEFATASLLLQKKYPEFATIISDFSQLPWPGMVFLRCDPLHIALLDYAKGFGNTVHIDLASGTDHFAKETLAAAIP
jgi:uncharacterized protein YhbP (UPF0306 family)